MLQRIDNKNVKKKRTTLLEKANYANLYVAVLILLLLLLLLFFAGFFFVFLHRVFQTLKCDLSQFTGNEIMGKIRASLRFGLEFVLESSSRNSGSYRSFVVLWRHDEGVGMRL